MGLLSFDNLGGGSNDQEGTDDDADDLLGGADDGLMGDDLFGGDDDDGGGSDEAELNYQLDEIEKEVDALENKVETVRGENERISESIESVDKNVDKLVDLYEIVTHGVNPFVGDQEIGDAFETATGQAGMVADDPEETIDEEIASAEAEDFLDEDMEFEDDDPDEFSTEFEDDPADDDPLDEEFADGDAFDDEEFDDLDGDVDDEGLEDDPDDDLTQFLPDEDEMGDDEAEDPFADDTGFDAADDDLEDELEADADESFESEAGGPLEAEGFDDERADEEGTPYLLTHPSRYGAEVATLEWLDFLVETAGLDGAAQTVTYYRSVGWISEPVEAYLHQLLCGFGDEGRVPADDPKPQSVLQTDEHKRSLQYIARIATPEKRTELVAEGHLEGDEI